MQLFFYNVNFRIAFSIYSVRFQRTTMAFDSRQCEMMGVLSNQYFAFDTKQK